MFTFTRKTIHRRERRGRSDAHEHFQTSASSAFLALILNTYQYLADLGFFVVDEQYQRIADVLGMTEWNSVVWIGRLFTLDNDSGEHWFDNWDLHELLEPEATRHNLAEDELLIIDPERFQKGKDGAATPQHSASASGPMCCVR